MKKNTKLYKIFVYVALITLAISIVVPIAWVFLASIKENSEFYGDPWAMPKSFYLENFVAAFEKANMGLYMWNSVKVTVLALFILIIVALPAAYVLARFKFKGRGILNTLFMMGLFINSNYIVVPIFLMLLDGDNALRKISGQGFCYRIIFVLYLLLMKKLLILTAQAFSKL